MGIFKYLLESTEPIYYQYSVWEAILLITIALIPWIALIVYVIIRKYRITFITNCDVEVVPQFYKGKTLLDLPTPVRLGYKFVGWCKDVDCEEPFTDEVMPSQNIKLYANWIEEGIINE